MKKLLVVTPGFHGYWRSIERAFTSLGYTVVTHCYDDGSRAEKAINKIRYEIPARLQGRQAHLSPEVVSARAIAKLRKVRPTHVLVIRGDVFTTDFWQAVHESGAVKLVWLYDELRRMTYDEATIGELAPIASYSYLDVAHLNESGTPATYVPLAYDHTVRLPKRRAMREVTFIGARFAKREEFLRAVHESNVPLRCYGRDWSSHWFDRLRTFRWKTEEIPSGRDLDLHEAWQVMRNSAGTINIHGDQDGFTMRTFEACGVGAVQLIDRADVADFFEPGREILTFETADELVELSRKVSSAPGDFDEMRGLAHKRALAEHTFEHRAAVLEELWG